VAYFTRNTVFMGSSVPHLSGITDLEIYDTGNGQVLYSASFADGGMNAFALSEGQDAVYFDQIGYGPNRGTLGLSDIDILNVAGQPILLPSGRYDDRTAIHRLGNDGAFESVRTLGASPEFIGGFSDAATLQIDGKTFMVAAQQGEAGFRSFRIRDDLSIEVKAKFDDDATSFTGDITALATAQVAGRSFFFAASALDAGVTSYWMGKWGNIKQRDSFGPSDGPGISAPSALETTVVDGVIYLLLGAAGTSSITVLRVNQFGGLFFEDFAQDTQNTRFENIAALESFSLNDRSFVLAGGSDDGLTLFELAPGGKLFELASIADQADTTLSNVTSIAASVVGGEVQVFVAGEGEAGITQFTLDPGNLAAPILGSDAADVLTGSAADDLLMGFDMADQIYGGEGNDRLVDGAGVDVLTGGAGADVFVFVKDARLDTISDFALGEDRIDLSDLDMLYDVSALDITSRSYGALIRFGAERLRVESDDGLPFLVTDFSQDDFILGHD
jgi:serralysin